MSKKENGNGADYLEEAGEHIKKSAKKAEKIAKEPGKLVLDPAGYFVAAQPLHDVVRDFIVNARVFVRD